MREGRAEKQIVLFQARRIIATSRYSLDREIRDRLPSDTKDGLSLISYTCGIVQLDGRFLIAQVLQRRPFSMC